MTWKRLERQQTLWEMSVLTTQENPSQENQSKDIFEEAFRALRPRTPLPEIDVKFRRYADVNNVIRVRDGKLRVGLSDLLEAAPRTVLEAIAFILIAKLYRKPIPESYHETYRRFLNRKSVRSQAQEMRRDRGRKWIGASAGEHYNLEELFDQLNREYFDGALPKPNLSWSRTVSRRLLGHFDAAHNAIIISKLFDNAQKPRLMAEFIMYHEMLHLKHPVTHSRDRRCFHSSQFRADEKKFRRYVEAKRLIEML